MKVLPVKMPNVNASLACKVDDEDYDELMAYRWCTSNGRYVRSVIDGKDTMIHRLLLQASPSEHVDHINGDPFDNRKENLRTCTRSENLSNRGKQKNNTTGFKGVFLDKRNGVWRAEVRFKNKKHCIGGFDTAEEAAIAYNQRALELHGEFAYLNAI